MIRRLPFRQKLTLVITATGVLAVALASVATTMSHLATFRQTLVEETASLAAVVGANTASALVFEDSRVASENLEALRKNASVLGAAVFTSDGEILARYDRNLNDAPFTVPEGGDSGYRFEKDRLLLWTAVTDGEERAGSIVVVVGLGQLTERFRRDAVTGGLVVLVSAVFAFMLSAWFQRFVSGPVTLLADAARKVSEEKDYSVRVPGHGEDELGLLTRSFNEMLVQIQRRDNALTQARERLELRVEERTRELVRAREEALEASRLKSEFVANLSHEIRTPMNGVIGMTEAALDHEMSGDAREALLTVRSSADHLLSLLNDILDFSKIEAGKLELESIPLSPRESVREAVRTFEIRARERGIELSGDVDEDVPEGMLGDPGRLRQVLLNLVGNAIKFTERGVVSVRARLESLDGTRSTLEFAVRDTGVGIPPDKIARIFESFQQADGSTTRRHGGTGLGLAISRRLVKMMGGRIWVESRPGEGSTFRFTVPFAATDLPAYESRVREKTPPPVSDEKRPPLRILLAEDNAINRKVATRLLERRGYTVHPAESGREALEVMARQKIDLILMDVQMPEMDGFEATACIRRAEAGGPRLPIIALTAHAMQGDRERCFEAGMDAYVPKPVSAESLYSTIDTLMDSTGQTREGRG